MTASVPLHDCFASAKFFRPALAAALVAALVGNGAAYAAPPGSVPGIGSPVDPADDSVTIDKLRQIFNAPEAGPWDFCIIILRRDGTLSASPDATSLTSASFGGQSARAAIWTTGGFNASVDSPASFSTAPAGGNADVTFSSTFSGQGSTSFSERAGDNQVEIIRGRTLLELNLAADKNSGAFPSGDYYAEQILRCE